MKCFSWPRIVARLDIKGPNLVKGVHFEGLRVLGKPEDYARYYYAEGADELIFIDAVASLYGRNSLLDVVERTAREVFIPLTVGGGLRTIEDIRSVLRAGADKVSLNTAAVAEPGFIRQAAETFGASTVVVSIDALRRPDGRYSVLTNYGRDDAGVDAIEWAQRAVSLGAGELLVTSVAREGTGKGFEAELLSQIAQAVTVPVMAGGGAGQLEHIREALQDMASDAVALASCLHYQALSCLDLSGGDYSQEGNTEFLRAVPKTPARIQPLRFAQIKEYLSGHGLMCRREVWDG